MKKIILFFLITVSHFTHASESIYLVCHGNDGQDREFIINKEDKTLKQVITGISEERPALIHSYNETSEQYVTTDNQMMVISINKFTMEFNLSAHLMDNSISIDGFCKKIKQVL